MGFGNRKAAAASASAAAASPHLSLSRLAWQWTVFGVVLCLMGVSRWVPQTDGARNVARIVLQPAMATWQQQEEHEPLSPPRVLFQVRQPNATHECVAYKKCHTTKEEEPTRRRRRLLQKNASRSSNEKDDWQAVPEDVSPPPSLNDNIFAAAARNLPCSGVADGEQEEGVDCGGSFWLDLSKHDELEFVFESPDGGYLLDLQSQDQEPLVLEFHAMAAPPLSSVGNGNCTRTRWRDELQFLSGGLLWAQVTGPETAALVSRFDSDASFVEIASQVPVSNPPAQDDCPPLSYDEGDGGISIYSQVQFSAPTRGQVSQVVWSARYLSHLVGRRGPVQFLYGPLALRSLPNAPPKLTPYIQGMTGLVSNDTREEETRHAGGKPQDAAATTSSAMPRQGNGELWVAMTVLMTVTALWGTAGGW